MYRASKKKIGLSLVPVSIERSRKDRLGRNGEREVRAFANNQGRRGGITAASRFDKGWGSGTGLPLSPKVIAHQREASNRFDNSRGVELTLRSLVQATRDTIVHRCNAVSHR